MGLTTADSGNILVQNYGRNPAVNFNFMLRVEALYDLPCRAVRVFQRENEYEYIQEGGLNDYVHMRRKPISKPFTFQVERYVGTDILDPLANGTDLILPIILYVSQYGIYNGPFLPIRMYTFTGCTVMGKEYGELNAEKSGLLVETTTIAYREMLCVENVAASFLQSDYWKFSGTDKQGDLSTPQRARYNETTVLDADGNQITIDDKKARRTYQKKAAEANMWQFGTTAADWEGNKKTHKHLNEKGDPLAPTEIRKDKLIENAEKNMWLFDGTNKKGAESGKSFAQHMKTNYEGEPGKTVGDEEKLIDLAKAHAEKNMWIFDGTKEGSGAKGKFARHLETSYKDEKGNAIGDEKNLLNAAKSSAEENMWQFGATMSDLEGNGKRHILLNENEDPLVRAETRLETLAKNAENNMWHFSESDKAGSGKQNAVHLDADKNWSLEKAIKKAEANRWPPKRNAADIVKFLEKK